MNSALTISANCCFALFRSRRCVCCCVCCCCQRRSAQRSAWKGLLGELLSRPGLPTCTCTGRSQGESVGGCSSGNFSWRGWGCKLLEPGGESADYQLMWAGLTIGLKSMFKLCGFSFFTLYGGDTKRDFCCVKSVKDCSLPWAQFIEITEVLAEVRSNQVQILCYCTQVDISGIFT